MDAWERKNTRLPTAAEVSYEHRGLLFNDRIADLSSSGFYIDTLHPLPQSSIISFRFVLPGDASETPISGEGEVAWAQSMQGMGIRITRIGEEDRRRLESFLSGSKSAG